MGNNLCVNHEKSSSSSSSYVLDQIISENPDEEQNPIYSLANYKKGGILINTYNQKGKEGIRKLAREFLPKFFEDKNFTNEKDQISVPLDDGPIHKRLWKLESRGLLGESLLHILVICNTPTHTEIALTLLELFPNLALDIIEGDEYFGASALHLSIAYQNLKLSKMLIENGADIFQRATGRFFKPTDQQSAVPKKQTNFHGLFYLGEYPLAWAACCEDETVYNLLIKYGADPNMTDNFGNMVLHAIVISDKQSMYGYALKHPTKPAKDDILNKYGLTPLALACKLGRNKIFREMLELRSFEFWRYSTITCCGYPLNALDSLLSNGKTNWNSAILIILSGNTNEHLDMLDGGVIERLLEEKWKTFARRQFMKRLSLIFIHLVIMSIAVFLRKDIGKPLLGPTDVHSMCRYCAEIGTCVGCIGFVIFQPAEEILAQGLATFFINVISYPPKAIFLLSCILILFCIPCRLTGDRSTEDILLSIALPGSWFFLMFFAGAIKLTGPFVTMIYSILTGDMFRFSIIYFIFLLAFTQAFYFLFKSQKSKRFQTYPKTWITLFQMTLGNYEYDELRRTVYYYTTQVVFTVFLVFMPILLLNMLIAMMGNTYCQVIEQSEKEWVKQWAKIVVTLERAVSQKKAREYMQCYSIPVATANDEQENRAVMVIRRKLKSKARQRKGALSNWKRMGRRVIFQLRKSKQVDTNSVARLNDINEPNEKFDTGNEKNNGVNSNILISGMLDNVCTILEAYSIDDCLDPSFPTAPNVMDNTTQEGIIKEEKAINIETCQLVKNVEELEGRNTLSESKTSIQTGDNKEKKEINANLERKKSLLESEAKFTSSALKIASQEIVLAEKKDIDAVEQKSKCFLLESDQKYSRSLPKMSSEDVDENKKKIHLEDTKKGTKLKICKKRKRHTFNKSKVGILTNENELNPENSWIDNTKLHPIRPKSSYRSSRVKNQEKRTRKRERCSKKVKMSESSSLEELNQYYISKNPIKQKGLTHWSTKDVVDMKSLVAWNEDFFREDP
ncbi:transient receptor potential cation channel subfamily V member 5-like [Centruroides vittatus]|uniref:transient receptor potential cation channel subfamily V member 5-like n=1 Tax=Centruroides vittatus TaxID=120091 RepID=UPI00350F00A6